MLRAATHPLFEVVLAVVIAFAHPILNGAAGELQRMQDRTSSPCRDADSAIRLVMNDCCMHRTGTSPRKQPPTQREAWCALEEYKKFTFKNIGRR